MSAKITRYAGDLKAFGINATGTNRTVFGDVAQSDTLDDNVNTDYRTGWEIVGASEVPTKQDFNALGFTLGQLIAYLHQVGVPEWDSLQEYHEGSFASVSGVLYVSQSNANIGNDPATDAGTDWIPVVSSKIQTVDASVAANALTLTLDPTALDFRSATLADGTINPRNVSSAISVVVSAGSTLGTLDGVAARLMVLAIDNAGAIELAAINAAGGHNLDETTVISTTAEGGAGGADSASIAYSTTARSNVPFRVVGFIDITEAVAGTWAAGPTAIQGAGGNALAPIFSTGYGVPQDVKASRSQAVTYYNTTGKPLFCHFSGSADASVLTTIRASVSGIQFWGSSVGTLSYRTSVAIIVPPGGSYFVTSGGGTVTIEEWIETL